MHFGIPSQAHNVQTLKRSPLSELSGALGDIGTLLPLMLALTVTRSIDLSATLVFTGIANIATGLIFGIPLPVQPMKAIAAVAIARQFSPGTTAGAGLFVSGVILVASITGLLSWLGRVVPIPVVKGIQVGAGLSLVISAGTALLQPTLATPSGADNWIWALAAFLLLLLTTATAPRTGPPKVPYALIVFVLGVIIAITRPQRHEGAAAPFFGIWKPRTRVPTPSEFREGVLTAGLGQLPLTTLNSIIAVTHLSADLLPQVPAPSFSAVGVSVAAMNLIGCWFGAMPVCHGSGGLAAQYRFGARSGVSIVFLGLVKLILGLFINDLLLTRLFYEFPKSVLGIMVIAAGVELARAGEGLNWGARDLWIASEENDSSRNPRELNDKERRDRWMVMMITVAGLLAFKNDAVGFLAGLAWHYSIKGQEWWETRSSRNEADSHSEETARLLD